MIHLKLGKRFKFDFTNKWYIHKQESVPENETHKILLGFNHLIQIKIANLALIDYKKTNCDECEKRNYRKIFRSCLRTEETLEPESVGDISYICTCNDPQRQ